MWWTVAEIAVGVLYLVGAVFNAVYTLRNTDTFYGDFAANAWLEPAGTFVRNRIVPSGVAFTIALIVFQVTIAIAILTRGPLVGPALLAGGVFALVAALFSSPGGTIGNLVLAAIQIGLAASR